MFTQPTALRWNDSLTVPYLLSQLWIYSPFPIHLQLYLAHFILLVCSTEKVNTVDQPTDSTASLTFSMLHNCSIFRSWKWWLYFSQTTASSNESTRRQNPEEHNRTGCTIKQPLATFSQILTITHNYTITSHTMLYMSAPQLTLCRYINTSNEVRRDVACRHLNYRLSLSGTKKTRNYSSRVGVLYWD
jgi:hypothetical protein